MKLVSVALVAMVVWFGAGCLPTAAAPAPVACFDNHCDTQLDITHADITALLVGCNPHDSDRVTVNGKPADGILWTLLGVNPAHEKPIDPGLRRAVIGLKKPVPSTYPEVRVRLKPGYYGALTIAVGDCSFGPIQLTTTDASSDRHIVLLNQPNPALPATSGDGVGGVYGYVPVPGLQITLTGGSPEQTLVARNEVDPNPFNPPHGEIYMYFFDAVKPGHYEMTASGFGWTKALGEVVVSHAGDVVLRYIHADELGL